MPAARKVVNTCMGVKRGERVLVVTDPPRIKIGRAIQVAALEGGTRCFLICMPVTKRHGDEPPPIVAHAMKKSDVVIAPTTFSITHTKARRDATAHGARVVTMPAITEEMMGRGAMLADYEKVGRLTKKLAKRLDGRKDIRITTRAGTDLFLSIKGRRAHLDTGIYRRPGDFGNLPAGEVAFAPVEGSANGKAVIDGPMGSGAHGVIEVKIKQGFATKITGKSAGKIIGMLRGGGPNARNLAEFGVGTNPDARLTGNVLEDEKVLGTCHIAFGDNSSFGGRIRANVHIDGIIRKPTIQVDGRTLMANGRILGL